MPKVGKIANDRRDAEDAAQQAEIDALKEGEAATELLTANGAISKTTGIKAIFMGSAGAFTLAAPAIGEEGRRLTIVSGTAFAHVITATNLIDDGVAGGAKDTITFAAFIGASIELVAFNYHWVVISKNAATIAAV